MTEKQGKEKKTGPSLPVVLAEPGFPEVEGDELGAVSKVSERKKYYMQYE